MQQGRVQIDADWNEAMDILAYLRTTTAADLVGNGAPLDRPAFKAVLDDAELSPVDQEQLKARNLLPSQVKQYQDGQVLRFDFLLSPGRFYVDGVLLESDDFCRFTHQPDLTQPGLAQNAPGWYLLYLDTWERHLTALDDPWMREVALGGADHGTRLKTVWQVKAVQVAPDDIKQDPVCGDAFPLYDAAIAPGTGQLMARAQPPETASGPCIIAPTMGYRRLENQLYRVEIHTPGALGTATFKWSRDNGSVAGRVSEVVAQNKVRLTSNGRDGSDRFAPGQWVELTTDAVELSGQPGVLVRLAAVDDDLLTLDTAGMSPPPTLSAGMKLRRWDFPDTSAPTVAVAADNDGWLPLEDGVQVKFTAGSYKTGDYWLVPARTLTGDVLWPQDAGGQAVAQSPQGVQHRYCRLAILNVSGIGVTLKSDCRVLFPPLATLIQPKLVPLEVTAVNRREQPALAVAFHDNVSTAQLTGGLVATFDRQVAAAEDACQVVLDLPYPLSLLLFANLSRVLDPANFNQAANAKLSGKADSMAALPGLTEIATGRTGRLPAETARRMVNAVVNIAQDSVVGRQMAVLALASTVTQLAGIPLVGYQPLTLPGRLTTSGQTLIWQPVGALTWLTALFRMMRAMRMEPRLRARLQLKRQFIWAATEDGVQMEHDFELPFWLLQTYRRSREIIKRGTSTGRTGGSVYRGLDISKLQR